GRPEALPGLVRHRRADRRRRPDGSAEGSRPRRTVEHFGLRIADFGSRNLGIPKSIRNPRSAIRHVVSGRPTMRAIVAVAITVVSLLAALPSAQAPRPTLRTPDGHPDLQGTYDIASMTPLERAQGTPLAMTREEAARFERERADRVKRLALPSNGD